MKIIRPQTRTTIIALLFVAVKGGVALADEVELSVEAYTEDTSCSEVVYVEIGSDACPDASSCSAENDETGEFQYAISTSCTTDRTVYIATAFKGESYLTIETYASNCAGELYDTRSYLADGECHPYKYGHFKIGEGDDNTTSVFISDSGCDSTDWNEDWSALTDSELNTGACITNGMDTWKSYLVGGSGSADSVDTSSATEPTSTPSATTATPTGTTATPTSSATLAATSYLVSAIFLLVSAMPSL